MKKPAKKGKRVVRWLLVDSDGNPCGDAKEVQTPIPAHVMGWSYVPLVGYLPAKKGARK